MHQLIGRSFFDLRNQVSLDSIKLLRISEYESRIEALMRTLAIWCDAPRCIAMLTFVQ